MRKVVINVCYGGFSLSEKAVERYLQLQPTAEVPVGFREVVRDDPILIQVVEEFGAEKAAGRHADLKIVEIPDDVKWTIEEYDGMEWVAEVHRTWN
jgi:hypothetical protein